MKRKPTVYAPMMPLIRLFEQGIDELAKTTCDRALAEHKSVEEILCELKLTKDIRGCIEQRIAERTRMKIVRGGKAEPTTLKGKCNL